MNYWRKSLAAMVAFICVWASCTGVALAYDPGNGGSERGCIGGLVWFDVKANQYYTPADGDIGIPGVKVVLWRWIDVNGVESWSRAASGVTGPDGRYLFSGIRTAGTFSVVVGESQPTTLVVHGGRDLVVRSGDWDHVMSTSDPGGPLAGMTPTWDYDEPYGQPLITPHEARVELKKPNGFICVRNVDFGYTRDTASFTTFTMGGWGSPPRGENPGALLHADFSSLYGTDGLVLGGWYTLTFKAAQEITNFLPQGGVPGTLGASYAPPEGPTEAGVFAGQVLALRLNVDFSDAGITESGLGQLKIAAGPYEGWTVSDLLDYAEEVLGGDSSILITSLSVLNDTVMAINENYCDGADNGFLTK